MKGVNRYDLQTDVNFSTFINDGKLQTLNEPSRGKTNNVVSEQVRHKLGCTSTDDG